jgi:quercetin dioxygenase-like cupin family protein
VHNGLASGRPERKFLFGLGAVLGGLCASSNLTLSLSLAAGSLRRLAFFAAAIGIQAQTGTHGGAQSLPGVKFEQDDDVKCLLSAVETGNPAKGPSTIILKAPPNCAVPWHYHTAQEQLIVVQGRVRTEMDGMSPHALGPGGFAMMPSKAKHQFSCQSKTACVMFVTFDRPYDIFWTK